MAGKMEKDKNMKSGGRTSDNSRKRTPKKPPVSMHTCAGAVVGVIELTGVGVAI